MKSYFNVIFIFYCILTINSQIIGNVSDDLDNKLEYATVVLYEQNSNNQIDGVITNIDGDFKFNNIKDGNYYVTASFLGYKTKKINQNLLKVSLERENFNFINLKTLIFFTQKIDL